jgi:predicted Rossmann fold flavoprotein
LKKLVVIGGGAAGFFCAVTAARLNKDLQVVLLEKTSKLLSKVRVSGGGRCNVTHALFDVDALSKRYPRGAHFVKKECYQFSPKDTIDWFAERGVQLKTEADGRMFPVTDSSQTIIDCLQNEALRYGVEIKQQIDVREIQKTETAFAIQGPNGYVTTADFVCIACGGYPKTSMFNWLTILGHTIVEPVPSLFTFNLPKHPITALMGVSVPRARVKIEGSKLSEEGPVLITHWGLSGPAVVPGGPVNWQLKITFLKPISTGCRTKQIKP